MYLRGEYTRTSGFLYEISAAGKIVLQDKFGFRGGFSLGRTLYDTDINLFLYAGYSPFPGYKFLPFTFSLSYIFNSLPEYKNNTNSIFPLISYNARYGGISLGCNFRFTSVFRELAAFEAVLSVYAYANFVNNERLRIGMGIGNFNDFHAKNLGAFSLNINSAVRINGKWSIVNEIEFLQSGLDGLSTTTYGISMRAGAKFSW